MRDELIFEAEPFEVDTQFDLLEAYDPELLEWGRPTNGWAKSVAEARVSFQALGMSRLPGDHEPALLSRNALRRFPAGCPRRYQTGLCPPALPSPATM
jgi:hypothetical protein